MNEKELLNRKVIVYSLLSALVVLAGSRARNIKCTRDNEKTAEMECHQQK
ncbi:hypothetical protein MNQ98_28180 [Paenibacillus sp. N3/727]|nr:hypothetical protein [Paenibacillus sp. N3/727]UNK18243.1 hypothetical protein MNQ98_28180 [Paenibacillus sp. N3/727]